MSTKQKGPEESKGPEKELTVLPMLDQEKLIADLMAQLASVQQQLAEHEERLSVPNLKDREIGVEVTAVKLDETAHGGRYVVDGRLVDANGKPVPGYSVINGEAVKDK